MRPSEIIKRRNRILNRIEHHQKCIDTGIDVRVHKNRCDYWHLQKIENDNAFDKIKDRIKFVIWK